MNTFLSLQRSRMKYTRYLELGRFKDTRSQVVQHIVQAACKIYTPAKLELQGSVAFM